MVKHRPEVVNFCGMHESEEHYIIINLIIRQAIYDYVFPRREMNDLERWTAEHFLWDDDYLVDYGDLTLSPRNLAALIDYDLDYIRRWISEREIEEEQKQGLPDYRYE